MCDLLKRTTTGGLRVRIHDSIIAVNGAAYHKHDFEESFQNRHSRLTVPHVGDVRVLSWQPGFGCHIARLAVGEIEFRYVRTGLSTGWFDLGGGFETTAPQELMNYEAR